MTKKVMTRKGIKLVEKKITVLTQIITILTNVVQSGKEYYCKLTKEVGEIKGNVDCYETEDYSNKVGKFQINYRENPKFGNPDTIQQLQFEKEDVKCKQIKEKIVQCRDENNEELGRFELPKLNQFIQ